MFYFFPRVVPSFDEFLKEYIIPLIKRNLGNGKCAYSDGASIGAILRE
jgi:hypothetical protein